MVILKTILFLLCTSHLQWRVIVFLLVFQKVCIIIIIYYHCHHMYSHLVGSRHQVGLHRAINISKTYETILPAWRMTFTHNESLFEALYGKLTIDVCVDVMKNNISLSLFYGYFLPFYSWNSGQQMSCLEPMR